MQDLLLTDTINVDFLPLFQDEFDTTYQSPYSPTSSDTTNSQYDENTTTTPNKTIMPKCLLQNDFSVRRVRLYKGEAGETFINFLF